VRPVPELPIPRPAQPPASCSWLEGDEAPASCSLGSSPPTSPSPLRWIRRFGDPLAVQSLLAARAGPEAEVDRAWLYWQANGLPPSARPAVLPGDHSVQTLVNPPVSENTIRGWLSEGQLRLDDQPASTRLRP